MQSSQLRANFDFNCYLAGDKDVQLLRADYLLFVKDLVLVLTHTRNAPETCLVYQNVFNDVLWVDALQSVLGGIVSTDELTGEFFMQEFGHDTGC